MQELRQFIKEQLYENKVAPTINYRNTFFDNDGMSPIIECASNYYDDNFPETTLLRIYNEEKFDPVQENLNTHDTKLLVNKLLQYFSDYIYDIKEYKGKGNEKKYSIGVLSHNSKELSQNQKFINLVEFYGYRISQVDNDWIGIISVYAESVKDVVEANHYRFYHFTNKKNVQHILKNGLQIRKGKYREFPERVHLYSEYRPIKDIRKEVEWFAKKVTNLSSLQDIAILKIDLHSKYNRISFYKDDAMPEVERAVYCYHNIVPKFIKEIGWN